MGGRGDGEVSGYGELVGHGELVCHGEFLGSWWGEGGVMNECGYGQRRGGMGGWSHA